DPTVIYGIVDGKPRTDGQGPLGRRLLRKDLDFDSPYNTYLYPDLPPTPICNPSTAAIEAVLNPEQHDYIYMVADGTGGHAFAVTLREHNDNVAQWRKIRAQQEAQ
ncbi:MAG: endolytic transglycosylase MltG, partial [Alphaproteobacteria bacterium]